MKRSCQRDWDVDSEFDIERAHHSPGSHPTYDQPQRLIMISCEGEGGAVWSGCNISLFPDMIKELAERRKAFSMARQLLHHKKVKFRLAFPATLGFTWRERSRKVSRCVRGCKVHRATHDWDREQCWRQLEQRIKAWWRSKNYRESMREVWWGWTVFVWLLN